MFGLLIGISALFRALGIFLINLKSAKNLHENIMKSMIKAPINEFFDRIPTGRILNRVTYDLSILDEYLCWTEGNILIAVFSTFGDIFFGVFTASYYILIPVSIYVMFGFLLCTKFLRVFREIIRLENISRSPILNLYKECLNGVTSLRVYNIEK